MRGETKNGMEQTLLKKVRDGFTLTFREQILLVVMLSIPAILAQISSIIMQYIDASMVGRLGAGASAAVGLVSTTTWLTGGLCNSVAIGFTVRVAHRIGAKDEKKAREPVRYGLVTAFLFSLALMTVIVLIHRHLPVWLGGSEEIRENAARYFLIYGCTLPLMQLNLSAGGMLQSSGDMRTTGFLHILMCFLDVVFNYFLIFPTRTVQLFGHAFRMPGAGLQVTGAALGTLLAVLCSALLMLRHLLFVSPPLRLRREEKYRFRRKDITDDLKISFPVMISSVIMGFAYVAGTRIVAPLGTIAIAANSFAVTAESLCYMPGYGIGAASTTVVGQAKGAGRRDLSGRLGWLSVALGALSMAVMAVFLYFMAPVMLQLLTPDPQVRAAGVQVLRIIAFAEPLYGASIVAEGVFRGLGRTRIPTVLNLVSMWCVRIPLSVLLARRMGLPGVWTAQCIELCFRGTIYLTALRLTGRQTAGGLNSHT